MAALLTLVLLGSSFPLPAVDGKALAAAAGQTTFRLPRRFELVRDFYARRFEASPTVTTRLTGLPGKRVLTLTNRDRADTWRSATVTEAPGETVVEVRPVLRMEAAEVQGNARPLVEFVIGRSPEVERAVKSIDHTEAIRR